MSTQETGTPTLYKPSLPGLQESLSDWACADLALVDGDGPGQLERQLLPTHVDPAAGLNNPALRFQHLCDARHESHAWEP